MGCRVSIERAGDQVVHHLHDDDSGASASILPGYGFNLFDLRLPIAGAIRPILYADPEFAASPSRPARSGIPVLFPFPNRIDHAGFEFQGKSYDLTPNKPPHAIHGFALDAPWEVVEHAATASGATILGRFQTSRQAPQAVDRWPADATLELRYTLAGRSLTLDILVKNPSGSDLPFGFGVHSYFRLPLDPAGDPSRTLVVLPASRAWVQDGGIPSGEKRPVSGRDDYRQGLPMAGLEADELLTGLDHAEGGRGVCRLVDRSIGGEVRLVFDENFRELVVFTPPNVGGVVAVEPYTQASDAVHLQARGIDAGLRVLPPGGSAAMRLVIEAVG